MVAMDVKAPVAAMATAIKSVMFVVLILIFGELAGLSFLICALIGWMKIPTESMISGASIASTVRLLTNGRCFWLTAARKMNLSWLESMVHKSMPIWLKLLSKGQHRIFQD